jgi:hypothetical protein
VRKLLVALLFLGTCAALFPLAIRVADPMTHLPVTSRPGVPFPVLVIDGGVPAIVTVDPGAVPPLPRGASYLVPRGREAEVERRLNAGDTRDGSWRLRVEHLGPARQHIELYWISDGYFGGAYEATATAIVPRYRKLTGAGFAFIVLATATGMALLVWVPLLVLLRRRVS